MVKEYSEGLYLRLKNPTDLIRFPTELIRFLSNLNLNFGFENFETGPDSFCTHQIQNPNLQQNGINYKVRPKINCGK